MTTLLLFGATGVVGGAVLELALQDPRIDEVLAVSRRPPGTKHPRLRGLIHEDFRNFEALVGELRGVSACVYALGMPWPRATSEQQYREVTKDYVEAAAGALATASPSALFCFVSGHGAGHDSRQTWARIKADAEDTVAQRFGDRARILRPGYIYPVRSREIPYWGDAVMRPFMLFRRRLVKYITDSDTVARALLQTALGGAIRSPADNFDIQKAAAEYRLSIGARSAQS